MTETLVVWSLGLKIELSRETKAGLIRLFTWLKGIGHCASVEERGDQIVPPTAELQCDPLQVVEPDVV